MSTTKTSCVKVCAKSERKASFYSTPIASNTLHLLWKIYQLTKTSKSQEVSNVICMIVCIRMLTTDWGSCVMFKLCNDHSTFTTNALYSQGTECRTAMFPYNSCSQLLVNYITKTARFVPNITCGQMSSGLSD